jgi:hypothetical protein
MLYHERSEEIKISEDITPSIIKKFMELDFLYQFMISNLLPVSYRVLFPDKDTFQWRILNY